MAIVIHPADLNSARGQIIETLSRWLTPLADGRRFDWLYSQNPHGQALVWIALDDSDGRIVGASAVFPRRMYVRGVEKLGGVLGDFCIHPSYRSLGPALQLQRATLEGITRGGLAFGYDFPSASMMGVYKRLGFEAKQHMIRLAKPLRADRKISEKVKVPVVARGLSAVGNRVLECWDRRLRKSAACTVSLHQDEFGAEFTALAQQLRTQAEVCVVRSKEYLNWRYRAHPFRRYEVLTAHRDGELLGFAILTQTGDDSSLADLFAIDDAGVLRSLVGHAVTLLRKRGAVTLSAPMLAAHPWAATLAGLGFRARDSCPVVVYAPEQAAAAPALADGAGWHLMDGNRES